MVNSYFLFLPILVPALKVLGDVVVVLGISGMAIITGIAISQSTQKKAQNPDSTNTKQNLNKNPSNSNFPAYNPNQNQNPNPNKTPTQEPVADKNRKGKPTPNNPDNPIPDIPERNIPTKTPTTPFSNQTPTPTPTPDPINVGKPPFFKQTGTFIHVPIEKTAFTLRSMPVNTSTGDTDWTELDNAQLEKNKLDSYTKYLADSRTNQEETHNISDIMPYLIPPSGNINGVPTLFSGTESLGKLQEGYDLYSDAYFSTPLFFIPTTINIQQIKGVTNNLRRITPEELNTNLEPSNEAIPKILQDNSLFKIPKEVNVERLLEFAGNVSSYSGGAEKWEQYRKDPKVIKDPNFFKVPSSSDILNETIPADSPKYQKQNLKIKSQTELLLLLAGTLYTKSGLHEFPSEPLPSVKNPNPLPENDSNQLNKADLGIRINNLSSAIAYVMSWFNFKVGDFPAEIEVPDPEAPEKQTTQKVNISSALTNLLTLAGIGLTISNFNKDINLTNSAQIEAAKNAALKSSECSCAALDALGSNTNAKARCKPSPLNFFNAKGFDSMLSQTQGCYTGVANEDNVSIKEMLQQLLFAANITKQAFFKGEKEIDNQEKVLKDLLKGKINDDELEEFIKKFNDQKTNLTKDYPVKSKIVKKQNTNQ